MRILCTVNHQIHTRFANRTGYFGDTYFHTAPIKPGLFMCSIGPAKLLLQAVHLANLTGFYERTIISKMTCRRSCCCEPNGLQVFAKGIRWMLRNFLKRDVRMEVSAWNAGVGTADQKVRFTNPLSAKQDLSSSYA